METIAGSAGVVRIGREQRVRRLTIRSNDEAKAAITVDQFGKPGLNAEVTDCTLEGGTSGGRRGVMINQDGAEFAAARRRSPWNETSSPPHGEVRFRRPGGHHLHQQPQS
jgi:hypothetical protein